MKSYDELQEPKEFKVGNLSCAVGKIPAFYAQRIILAAGGALSDMDMTKLPESVILELLSYCAVKNPAGEYKVLDDLGVVNLLIDSPKDLIAIEIKAVEYNFGFFLDGSLREVFAPLIEQVRKSAETSTRSQAS